jgi:hypothetical protein
VFSLTPSFLAASAADSPAAWTASASRSFATICSGLFRFRAIEASAGPAWGQKTLIPAGPVSGGQVSDAVGIDEQERRVGRSAYRVGAVTGPIRSVATTPQQTPMAARASDTPVPIVKDATPNSM